MFDQTIRFVILGSGSMAGTYARILADLPGAELVGTVSRTG